MFLWVNFLSEDAGLWRQLVDMPDSGACLQYFIDHPLTLAAAQVDRMAGRSRYTLALPCLDGVHLLRLRWPTLKHMHCLHGVPASAMCDESVIEAGHLGRGRGSAGRGHQLVILGSIHDESEIDLLRRSLPARLVPVCEQMAQLLCRYPWMAFEQALDICIGAEQIICGHWPTAARLFNVITGTVNRRRRVGLIQAMQGIETVVYGSHAWREFCSGTNTYGGQLTYAEVPKSLAAAGAC